MRGKRKKNSDGKIVQAEVEIIENSTNALQDQLNLSIVYQMLNSLAKDLDLETALILAACGKKGLWEQLCQCHQTILWIESIEITDVYYPERIIKKKSLLKRFVEWFRKLSIKKK